MKKTNRVVKNKDFSLVIKSGQLKKNNTFKVYCLENKLQLVRVGIAASTKLGNAVIRSTTRRKIRAICDLLIDYDQYSLDLIIVPKNSFLEQDYSKNKSDLQELLENYLRTKKWKEEQNLELD